MYTILKGAAATALLGAVVIASATPGEARNRWIGPAAAGFAAGAIVGSAATANAYGYGPGYYAPGYAYAPAPAYAPSYGYESSYDAYAYDAPVVYAPRYYYRGRSGSNGCYSQGNYGQSVDESACNR
jgi:hypothetical protein